MKLLFRAALTLVSALSVCACVASASADSSPVRRPYTTTITAQSGRPVIFGSPQGINADCSVARKLNYKAVSGPKHGRVTFQKVLAKPAFAKSEVGYKCNSLKIARIAAMYGPNVGYVGRDEFKFITQSPDGTENLVTLKVVVSAP